VEALIDFGEGEDLEEGVYEHGLYFLLHIKFMTLKRFLSARIHAQELLASIKDILSDNRRGEIIRSGIRLAIFGPPNAGKSSLLNFLGKSWPLFRPSLLTFP
jgi:tRNA modification GTPase